MRAIFIVIIKAYQLIVSPALSALGARCRFHPTCSEYAIAALSEHGFVKAGNLISKRILRCGPWTSGGVDFVPTK